MRRGPIDVLILSLVAIGAVAPVAASANRVGGEAAVRGVPSAGHAFVGRPAGVRSSVLHRSVPHPIVPRPFVPHAFPPHPFVPHAFPSHPFVHRPLVRPFVFFGPPLVAITSPVVVEPPVFYDTSSVYGQASTYGQPVSSVSVAPTPSPMPTVVEYPDGRYELRGDGVTTPYMWVWIPNPPTAPPSTSPPATSPPAAPPPASKLGPSSPEGRSEVPARHSRYYRWTDERGVLHLTDRPDSVPAQYRAQAAQAPAP